MSSKINKLKTVLCGMLLFVAASASAQSVKGTVVDNSGEPMIGVTVLADGKAVAVTDIDGNFEVPNASPSTVIKVSYVGYKDQEVKVGNSTSLNITLQEDNQALDEVVVVGYGTMKKSDLTGSVSSVSTEKLNAKGAPSVMENLQGATPGVNITQSGARAGGEFDIEIRGKSSINASTSPLYVVDGIMCDDIQFLNPQDIERIDVLKDASSTAIYGSRATAGVIMVTTKSGSSVGKNSLGKVKTTVSYDGYYGVTKVARMPEFQDGQAFYNYRFSKFLNSPTGGLGTSGNHAYAIPAESGSGLGQALLAVDNTLDIADPSTRFVLKERLASGETYDWPSLVTQNGHQQNHYLAVSGAGEKLNYHVGLGYNQEEGIYSGDEQTRINFKGSLDAKLSSLVKVGFSFNMAHIDNDYANDDAIKNAYYMIPFMAPYYTENMKQQYISDASAKLESGAYTQDQYDSYVASIADIVGKRIYQPGQKEALGTNGNNFTSSRNPLNLMQSQSKNRETWRLLGNIYLELTPLKGLSLKTTFSPNYTYYRQGTFAGYINDFVDPVAGQTKALAYDDATYTDGANKAVMVTNRGFSWTWDNIVNYSTTIAEDHSLNLMGLFSLQANNSEKIQLTYKNVMENSDWWNLASGTYDAENSSNAYGENSMLSYALRANYTYKGKYMFTGTVRWDGSSKFAKDSRWGCFPSAALAWRISEENFIKEKAPWVSNLKLRLSYGVTGNCDGISNYPTYMTPTGPVYYQYGNSLVNGFYIKGIADQALKWEKSYEINGGLDFGFLRNRITGSIDVYQKTSQDLLYDMTLPLAGYSLTTNIGKVRNRGVELSLNTVNIATKDWYWETTFSFAHNSNKVMEINGTGTDLPANSLFIGQPYNNVYGYEWDGVVTDRMMTVPDNAIAKEKGLTPGTEMREYDYYYTCYGWSEGMPKVVDQNGDGKFNEEDKTVRKSDPSWTGSFTTNLSYKNWDFSMSIYAKQHYTVASTFYGKYMEPAQRGQLRYDMDYYIPAGTLIDCDGIAADGTYINPVYQETTHYGEYPFPNYLNNSGISPNNSEYLNAVQYVDASYVKVKNITLGYTFPQQWINKFGCHHLRLYLTVTNPFVFTNYKGFDPEWANASLKNDGPSTVTWQIGANIKF